jgi:shikimate dehydrogenase
VLEINYDTKVFGVIGKDIKYTLSPYIHNFSFNLLGINAIYLVFDLSEEKFSKVISSLLEITEGLNVTIPYKEKVIAYLNGMDEISKKIDAVNTIFRKNGYNTDYIAVKSLVKEKFGNISGFNCYIYGAGGAAKASSYALAELGCIINIINRTKSRAIELVENLNKNGFNASVKEDCEGNSLVIVNTTPYSQIVPEKCVKKANLVIDFVYKPVETDLIKIARNNNISFINGLEILVRQAMEAEKIWFNKSVPDEKIIEYLYARKLVW